MTSWWLESTPPKNMKVSWGDEIPNIWRTESVPHHQSDKMFPNFGTPKSGIPDGRESTGSDTGAMAGEGNQIHGLAILVSYEHKNVQKGGKTILATILLPM